MSEQLNTATDKSTVASTPRKKTMSPASIAANRANARKSTGPRTAAGKLKSASNALQHGLYSIHNFRHFITDNDLALEVATNVMEQFQPVTPTDHFLAHQLIHMQLRFLQMESVYNQAMASGPNAFLENKQPMLAQVLRELDRLPARIQRTIKALQTEQTRRQQALANTENEGIEPIPDQPPLPPLPPDNPNNPDLKPVGIRPTVLFELFAGRILNKQPSEEILEESNPSDAIDSSESAPFDQPEAA